MGLKTSSVGFFQIPTAPAALTAVAQSASANTLGSAVSFGNSPSAMYITGVTIGVATTQVPTYVQIQILVAASIVASVLVPYGVSTGAAASVLTGYRQIYPPIPVANAAAITVKSASSVASAVSWGVSLECIAQANVVDDGVAQSTNVTQWNSSAVASPATAGIPDVNVKNINNVAAATPGASGGVLISGSNSGTTTLAALTITGATTHTGNVVMSDGLTISAPSTGNRAGLDIAGNGTGAALKLVAGATGVGFSVAGGGTSGDGIKVTTTSGHGLNLAPVGTSMHGLLATGGNGGTSDGIKAVAGTGGVPIRGDITGSITGSLSGSVGSVTGAVGSVTGAVGSVTGAVGSVTGLTASNLDATISSRMATYTQPTGFLSASFPTSVASPTNITAGTITTVTNLTNAATSGDFTTTMKTSIGTAVAASAVASVTGNVAGSIGSLGAQAKLDVNAEADTALSDVGVTTTVTGRIDAAISSRLASASYTAPDNTSVTAIKAKTDSLTFTFSNKLDVTVYRINGVTILGDGSATPFHV